MPYCSCGYTWDRSELGNRKCPRCLTTTNGQTRAQIECLAVQQWQMGMISSPRFGDCTCGEHSQPETSSEK